MDPISNMIAAIKNAMMARKQRVETAYSKINSSICQILKDKNVIAEFKVEEIEGKKRIVILTKEDSKLYHIKRLSKPGHRVYVKSNDIPRPLSGYGFVIISTSKGVTIGNEARKLGLGGELICEVW